MRPILRSIRFRSIPTHNHPRPRNIDYTATNPSPLPLPLVVAICNGEIPKIIYHNTGITNLIRRFSHLGE